MSVIAVVGAGQCDATLTTIAKAVGGQLAQQHITLVCGGLGGVMAAACQGAKTFGGKTIGILPGADPKTANPWVDIAIATGMGEARNAIIVHTAQVVIAVGGEYGTLSEIAFALKLGKPVIGIQTWQLAHPDQRIEAILVAQTPEEAVQWAIEHLQKTL
jgi:hypothetical protein